MTDLQPIKQNNDGSLSYQTSYAILRINKSKYDDDNICIDINQERIWLTKDILQQIFNWADTSSD